MLAAVSAARIMALKESDNPNYWLKRAEEARSLAEQMTYTDTKAAYGRYCSELREDCQVG